MKVHLEWKEWKPIGRTIASLGNFDGVHLGHQAILKRVIEGANRFDLPSVAITFDPVPKKILQPQTAPQLIQTLEQRLRKLESMQIDHTIVLAFNETLAKKSPQDFVKEFLIRDLKIKEFVVGANFSFGHQKSGNVALLRQMGLEHDFLLEGVPEVCLDGVRVSSTLIREKIHVGRIEEAQRFLGDPFSVIGKVVEGEKLGGKLGIPTANLEVENEILPAKGVYITRALFEPGDLAGVTNVGTRPTVGGNRLTVETHLSKEGTPNFTNWLGRR